VSRRRRGLRLPRARTWRAWTASARRKPRTPTGSIPGDPEAKVAKMKDGRTRLAHKAEHAVDLETGAMVIVTLQGADQGDTTTIVETAIAAAVLIEDAQAEVRASQ
jgi:transposase